MHACVFAYVCEGKAEKGGNGGGGDVDGGSGTGVCRDQCMVHTDVSSRRQGCGEEKLESEWRRGGEGRESA